MKKVIPALLVVLLFGCNSAKMAEWPASNASIEHYGRTLHDEKGNIILIGSASYVETNFSGDTCIVLLRSLAPENKHNYVSIEVDGEYKGRIKVLGDTVHAYTIVAGSAKKDHLLRIFKATEAQNGQVLFTGIKATGIQAAEHPNRKKIEFIGNSITCGMGNDLSGLPCGSGEWYDQHNAYLAYGPIASRSLNIDFMLSSVSGIGIYRTWNMDHPDMPQVYESAYLSPDDKTSWDFKSYTPDIVSICLGTNDLSDGDGKTPRAAFDSTVFINKYTAFIGTIYKNYPSTKIALLNSPMLGEEKRALLYACLQRVKQQSETLYPGKSPIILFQFSPMIPTGCSYHPSKEDHEKMAKELTEFLRKII